MKKNKDRSRGSSDRRSVNLVSGVLSILFVVLAAQLSDGKGKTSLFNIFGRWRIFSVQQQVNLRPKSTKSPATWTWWWPVWTLTSTTRNSRTMPLTTAIQSLIRGGWRDCTSWPIRLSMLSPPMTYWWMVSPVTILGLSRHYRVKNKMVVVLSAANISWWL